MKKDLIKKYYIILIIFGVVGAFFFYLTEIDKLEKAPKVDYKNSLNIDVHQISFERNGLFLNKITYNAKGISGYSKIFTSNGRKVSLDEIKPPFIMKKDKENDTLKIIKGNIVNYLLVREEQKFGTESD